MPKKYFYEIDGLRFYTFLLILINHTGLNKFSGGTSIFFALSGFLIAFTSYNDINKTGTFSFRRYARKRMLRTFPLYFLIVIGSGIFYLVASRLGASISFGNYWSFFVFLQNFFGYGTIFIMANLWSMAVTEQLYFGWGALARAFPSRLSALVLPLTAGAVLLAFIAPRIAHISYTNTVNYIGVYLMGACLGLLHFRKGRVYSFLRGLGPFGSALLALSGIGVIAWGLHFSYDDRDMLPRIYVTAAGFCILTAAACYANLRGKFIFTHPAVRYLGKVSYGLYCYHAILLTGVTRGLQYAHWHLPGIFIFFITLVLTIIVSIISYELFEKKFIARKQLSNDFTPNGKNEYPVLHGRLAGK